MPEILEKLRPDRDLQCYFFRPSAIAALSETSPNGFTLSGTWRQQFDWAVVEWNRDNVFEHPIFRNLPDGDLSGLTLSYDETRLNCFPLDSDLFPTVDWPSLRLWADDGAGEKVYFVPLYNTVHAAPIEGSYQQAKTDLKLSGTLTKDDYVGFAFLDEHYTYQVRDGDTLEYVISVLGDAVHAFSTTLDSSYSGRLMQLVVRQKPSLVHGPAPLQGVNGNRLGLYTYSSGAKTEQWDAASKQFAGGTSPSKWRITIPFDSLQGSVALPGGALVPVPANAVRKIRWTYAADLQSGSFQRSEFQVVISNWTVTGSGRSYSVAGPGSRRINDDASEVVYSGRWKSTAGNFSGGTIHNTLSPGASATCTYSSAQVHSLYLGTRLAFSGTTVSIVIDGQLANTVNLHIPAEDVLVRKLLGQYGPGNHTVTILQTGSDGIFYFDFLDIVNPTLRLPTTNIEGRITLATDWDTDHSIALSPERTAWIIDSLGFKGRVNHYVGALWFYELVCPDQVYASATLTFTGIPAPSAITTLSIARLDHPNDPPNVINHLNLYGDTSQTIAKAFEIQLNLGYTAIWAQATDNRLTIYSRSLGSDGNLIKIGVSSGTPSFSVQASGQTLSGGIDGAWLTDLQAVPRLNRAVRDWCRSFFKALKSSGHTTAAAAFSTELQNGDPSLQAGIAQRYPSGNAVLVNTPALQTNFSPASLAFWQQVYADMAGVQKEAGLQPYLQFGELQWWYFPDDHSGMPFYDAYTTSTFKAQYGRDLPVITSNMIDPATVPEELSFLSQMIGNHTRRIMGFVSAAYPDCQFEVLYPTDVNDTPLNRVVNFPTREWTPANLTCLKTESFGYTFARNLNLSRKTIDAGIVLGFPASQRSHLVGLEDSYSAWLKETRMAESRAFDSVVLFALDQFCLMGYPLPLSPGMRRSSRMG